MAVDNSEGPLEIIPIETERVDWAPLRRRGSELREELEEAGLRAKEGSELLCDGIAHLNRCGVQQGSESRVSKPQTLGRGKVCHSGPASGGDFDRANELNPCEARVCFGIPQRLLVETSCADQRNDRAGRNLRVGAEKRQCRRYGDFSRDSGENCVAVMRRRRQVRGCVIELLRPSARCIGGFVPANKTA